MFQIVRGDILHANTAFICHQVNCMNAMGAGLAKSIYTKWPEVKSEYHKFCASAESPEKLLGQIQVVPIRGTGLAVINVFGQLNYGRRAGTTYSDYRALQMAFAKINRAYPGKSVAFPYGFGCGLAGGDWATVEKIMLDYLWNCNVKVYYKKDIAYAEGW